MNPQKAITSPQPKENRFSPCRAYRYSLWRSWPRTRKDSVRCQDCISHGMICPVTLTPCDPDSFLLVIGLNPSTADEVTDDPTIRKVVKFAKAWGFGSLCMVNLFAFRATKPEAMKKAPDPIGGDNDMTLFNLSRGAGMVLAAWGNHGSFMGRDQQVVRLLTKNPTLHCLQINDNGSPKHPLYCKDTTVPIPFPI